MCEELLDYLCKNNISFRYVSDDKFLIDIGSMNAIKIDKHMVVISDIVKKNFLKLYKEEIECRKKIYGWKNNLQRK
jgi:hypothetical protein